MSTDEHMPWTQADLAKLDPPYDIKFRPGQGGEMSPEWAAYMLNLWWAARDKKLAFAEAVKLTVVHFMVGEQP